MCFGVWGVLTSEILALHLHDNVIMLSLIRLKWAKLVEINGLINSTAYTLFLFRI